MKGMKFDDKKLMWELLPMEVVEKIVEILTHGAKKYKPNNWKHVKPFEDRYYAALMRHLVAWRKNESVDPDSGYLHLAHVGCNAIFLLYNELNKENKDERSKKPREV